MYLQRLFKGDFMKPTVVKMSYHVTSAAVKTYKSSTLEFKFSSNFLKRICRRAEADTHTQPSQQPLHSVMIL